MAIRKSDHIKLAALSVPASASPDTRFNYEPLLSAHSHGDNEIDFLGKKIKHPLWISSMTGASKESGIINHHFAELSAEYGLGMGLGSCRSLLKSKKHLSDFNLRPIIGNDLPFYANLGIAQIEELLEKNNINVVHEMVLQLLNADGIIIHVNPAQEWLQPEGNLFKKAPIDTLSEFISKVDHKYKIIVKEVGQGIGPASIEELLKLEIDCLEFGAFGGTNFSSIELMRNKNGYSEFLYPITSFGHNALEMIEIINNYTLKNQTYCKKIIVSGGIKNFLDGYYYIKKSTLPALYGMANVLLQQALISKENLFKFIKAEIEGYKFSSQFLTLKL